MDEEEFLALLGHILLMVKCTSDDDNKEEIFKLLVFFALANVLTSIAEDEGTLEILDEFAKGAKADGGLGCGGLEQLCVDNSTLADVLDDGEAYG